MSAAGAGSLMSAAAKLSPLPPNSRRRYPPALGVALLPVAVLLVFGVFAYAVPDYLSSANLQQLMRDFAEPGLIAIAMAIVVLAGGIDLSVGATFAIANFLALYLFKLYGYPLALAIPITVASGALVGMLNGVLVGYMRTRAFLTTLAVLLILRAGYDLAADSYAVQLAEAMYDSAGWELLGSGNWLGIPLNIWILLAVTVLAHLFMTRTRPGIHIRAVGADRKAARHAGIAVSRSMCTAYVLSGAVSALAGLLYAARQNSAGSDTGNGMELAAITAVVLGGVSLAGGRGNVLRAVLGALLLFLVMNGLLRMNITGSMSSALTGLMLLAAVALNARPLTRRRRQPHAKVAPAMVARKAVASSTANVPALLQVNALSKVYGTSYALRDINLAIHAGEIHALIGENGAGKSTLCKIIAGAITPSAGQLQLDGRPLLLRSPAQGMRAGIAMVYQDSSLIPSMSVAQNLQLGEEPWFELFNWLNWGSRGSRGSRNDYATNNCATRDYISRDLLHQVGLDIDIDTEVSELSVAQRQLVEIARAIGLKAKLLIFDEPTASLNPQETQRFLALLQTLKARGVAIIFITHALEEALGAADRISILRDGMCIGARIPAHTLDRTSLVQQMVGRELPPGRQAGRPGTAATVTQDGGNGKVGLELRGVTLDGILDNVSIAFASGQVTAIAGLMGSGRTTLARLAAGSLQSASRYSGDILRNGTVVRYRSPRQAIADGVVYVTEDRSRDGLFTSMDVAANLYLAKLLTPGGWRFWYSRKHATDLAHTWGIHLAIAGLQPAKPLHMYSGGNQQKVTVARALVQKPRVILLDEPTHGVDVGAIATLHQIIDTLAVQGCTVVVVSSYLPEVFRLADRIVVMRDGCVSAVLPIAEASEQAIISAASH